MSDDKNEYVPKAHELIARLADAIATLKMVEDATVDDDGEVRPATDTERLWFNSGVANAVCLLRNWDGVPHDRQGGP